MLNEKRTIHISGNITDAKSVNFINQIYKMVINDKTSPIYIMINSAGGEARVTRAMVSAINASGCKIVTVITGVATGCAAIVFLQGGERVMFLRTELVFQEPNFNFGYISYSQGKEKLELLAKDYEFVISEMAYKTSVGRAYLMEKLKFRDYIFNPIDAVKIGFATKMAEKFEDIP